MDRDELRTLVADFPAGPRSRQFPRRKPGMRAGLFPSRCRVDWAGAANCAVEEKFGLDLGSRPTMVTVRGRSDGKDGRIHTDSESKIITLLLYLNRAWERSRGPFAAAARSRRHRRLCTRGRAARRNNAGVSPQRALIPRASTTCRGAPDGATQLGDRAGGCPARAQPPPLVGALEGVQPVCAASLKLPGGKTRGEGLASGEKSIN